MLKTGDLVRTKCGRFGIVKAYYPQYSGPGTSYPWYVYMPDNHWRIEYFQTHQLELVSCSK